MGIHVDQAGYCSKQTSPKLAVSAPAQEWMASYLEIGIKVSQEAG